MKKNSNSNFLFPGKVNGKKENYNLSSKDDLPKKPLREIKKGWATIRKLADLNDFRLHDLRHTHASHLVSSGLSLSIVGKLLGHTQASTTQRYAHLADEPLRQATKVFGDKFEKLSRQVSA